MSCISTGANTTIINEGFTSGYTMTVIGTVILRIQIADTTVVFISMSTQLTQAIPFDFNFINRIHRQKSSLEDMIVVGISIIIGIFRSIIDHKAGIFSRYDIILSGFNCNIKAHDGNIRRCAVGTPSAPFSGAYTYVTIKCANPIFTHNQGNPINVGICSPIECLVGRLVESKKVWCIVPGA